MNSSKTKFFLFWSVLEIVGQIATLSLIDAGNLLHYQHYRISDASVLSLSFLTIQALLVIAGIFYHRFPLLNWFKQHFRLWQLAMLFLLFVLSSAALSSQIDRYFSELLFGTFIQLVHLGNIFLITIDFPGSWKLPSWRSAYVPALLVFLLALALNFFSYENHPHVTDEVIYWIQAKFLAHGAMKLPAPPVPEGFEIYMMRVDGAQWYPATPPGWAALLAFGMALNVPWLINPVIAALNVLLTRSVVKQIYDEPTATATVWLLAVSPWYIFLAMSFMNHMLTLTCFLVGAWGILKSKQSEKILWAFLGGIAAGYTCWIRPLDGPIVLFFLGVWALKSRMKFAVAFTMGAAIVCGLLLCWNFQFTGNALQFPINVYFDLSFGKNSNSYGFGRDHGLGWQIDPYPGHSARDGILNSLLNAFCVNMDLFGWSTGSLIFAGAFVFSGQLKKQDWIMTAVILGILTAYFFYYFSGGPDFGARYWFLMIVPLVILSVRWIQRFPQAGVAAIFLSACALCLYVPWRAIDKYHHYWNMSPEVGELARTQHFGRSLVLIRGKSHPDYASAAVYNPLDLDADQTIFAWDRDDETRAKLLRHYSGRPVWILNGPTITKRGYEIVQSPRAIPKR